MMIMMMSNDDDDIIGVYRCEELSVYHRKNKRNETITKIKMMSGCRLPPRIYLDVYHRKMKNMMMMMMMMDDDAGDDDGVIFPCVWRIGRTTRGGSGAISDGCTAKTSYIWWNHKDCHFFCRHILYCTLLVVLHYKSTWCVSRVVDFVTYEHTCIHAKHCVNWFFKSSFTQGMYGKSDVPRLLAATNI